MSLSKRTLSALLISSLCVAAVGLSGCGFRPLHGQFANDPAATADLAAVEVKPIPNRVGQLMRTALQRRLNPVRGVSPLYALSVGLTESTAKLAIEQNAFATRANLTLIATFSVTRNQDGADLFHGQSTAVASYNILSSQYATLAAQTNARECAIDTLANDMRTRLAIYFTSAAAQSAGPAVGQSSVVRPSDFPSDRSSGGL